MQRVGCGFVTRREIGRHLELNGWVNRRRDHGGLVFIDLRDRDGLTQVVFDPENAAAFEPAHTLRHEDVIRVRGVVRARPSGTENPRLATGEVELEALELQVLSRSETPPFPVNLDEDVDEGLRLKYRYLDLRRPRLVRNLTVRHRFIKAVRDYFDAQGFLEIETPILIKPTPEGARDYLVPARLSRGQFYALPQSPQILKQLSMVSGLGRYMQIARCFRDEDSRSDRQPEFTQIDVEMSFVDQEDVMRVMESMMIETFEKTLDVTLEKPFARLSFAEAMRRFGSDKPDLRFDLELADAGEIFAGSEFAVFKGVLEAGGAVIALRWPGGGSSSRREFDAMVERAKEHGAKGLVWIALGADGVKSPMAKFLDEPRLERLRAATGAQSGDAILIVADRTASAQSVAGKLRLDVADRAGLRDPKRFAFCWVYDFPLFELDEETGRWTFTHHPFTSPAPGHEEMMERDPANARALHYDMVLNGVELGSGSIRITTPELQSRVFHALGMGDEEIQERFGFLLEAFKFGVPPMGGMALGVDRIVQTMVGESSIRDVIAFPKNQQGRDLMLDAPSRVPKPNLDELGLRLVGEQQP
ncbi:MAG: aspartate--tRNA ligase [bacterium]|nr:aspartate--tRNA ligase [bacterium]